MTGSIDISRQPALALLACFAVAMFLFSSITGCGGDTVVTAPDSTVAQTSDATQSTAAPESLVVEAKNKVVGTWLGGAVLDQAKLDQLVATKTEAEKQALLAQASSFLSTVMAIEFNENGQMINEVEITPHGMQTLIDSSAGSWKVVEADAERMIIETQTESPDGTMASDQKVYKFYEDGDHFAVLVPLQNELDECAPLIIFERQNMDEAAILTPLTRR